MRNWLLTLTYGALAASTALAQPYFAQQTGTILPTGPRAPTSGDNFFNVEGSDLGANASYGVARWDTAALRTNLNNAFGVGNWRITSVDLVLTQSNAAFSAAGDVRVYFTADDTTDIKTAASPLAYPFQDTPGTPDLPVNLADPLLTYTYTVIATGTEDVYNLYVDGDGGERLAVRDDLTNDGGQKLTLVLEDITTTVAATYRGQVGTPTADPPELRITAVPISGNPPTANAGPDQTVTDVDITGDEVVTLDGSGSQANPPATSIVSYVWSVGGSTVATGVSPNYTASLGTTTVTLTVTDNFGGTASDNVDITVLSGVVIVADAGDNATIDASTCDGSAGVSLDASGSSYNAGSITNYTWTNDQTGAVVASAAAAVQNANLAIGTHTLRLTITGSGGETDNDVVTLNVRPSTVFEGHDFDLLFASGGINIIPPGPFTSAGDGFGYFQRFVSSSIPFSLLDDTLATFPGDTLGCANDKKLDGWFGCNDLLNNDNPSGTGFVEMTFNIAGRSNIKLAVDMAAMGDFEASGATPDTYTWTAIVDGGAPIPLFAVAADEAGSYTYRMAGGASITLNDPLVLDGTILTNIFRTFVASIPSGASLVVRMDASNDSDEAYLFDNVLLYECEGGGDPCPCVGDLDGDGDRDISDLAALLSAFGLTGPPGSLGCADTDGDGDVDISDLASLLGAFGVPC